MLHRILDLNTDYNDSVFLWGARQVGKTTLLDELYPNCRRYDLLRAKDYNRLLRRPELLGEELDALGPEDTVVIDEVQKIPQLLDEVHSLIQRRGIRFILSGSSPRKLKRYGANLLGGRAVRKVLYPLVSAEVPDFDIVKAVNNGMIPRHYLVDNPWERFRAYINVYLNEEIREEAISRNLQSFLRFLEVAAQSDGEMLVYKNVAQDCGIDYRTVKSYFEILQDTLIGYLIPGFTLSKKRSAMQSPKFYYYDVGITNFLLGRRKMEPGSELFGHSFEHFIIQELVAWLGYHQSDERLTYWHTASGYEVDAIIGEGRVAIEVKSCEEVKSRHLRGLKAFSEDFPDCRLIVVSFDTYRRRMNGVEIIPVKEFLADLWSGKIL
ncbi:MAG: ATP-binding protein [Bacteroidales bacterium]|nr:ATP-binding protein [Bacteroidales bacterium]